MEFVTKPFLCSLLHAHIFMGCWAELFEEYPALYFLKKGSNIYFSVSNSAKTLEEKIGREIGYPYFALQAYLSYENKFLFYGLNHESPMFGKTSFLKST